MLPVQTLTTAPEASRPLLETTRRSLGFIPNLYGVFANNPGTLAGYVGLAEGLGRTGLSAAEQQLVLIAASVENTCEYCVAAHSTIATGGGLLDADTLAALREGQPLSDPRREALRRFTVAVVEKRGRLSGADLDAFLAAGFQPTHVLGVLTGVALKTLSNYTNHIAATPVDSAFQPQAWAPAGV